MQAALAVHKPLASTSQWKLGTGKICGACSDRGHGSLLAMPAIATGCSKSCDDEYATVVSDSSLIEPMTAPVSCTSTTFNDSSFQQCHITEAYRARPSRSLGGLPSAKAGHAAADCKAQPALHLSVQAGSSASIIQRKPPCIICQLSPKAG